LAKGNYGKTLTSKSSGCVIRPADFGVMFELYNYYTQKLGQGVRIKNRNPKRVDKIKMKKFSFTPVV